MKKSLILFNLLTLVTAARAQDPLADAANTLDGYFASAIKLMYAVAALLGIVGAVKAYVKFQRGDSDVWQAVSGWFGGCIFIVIVGAILNSFFR